MSEKRKSDHLDLSLASVPDSRIELGGLHYEPMLSAHPDIDSISYPFLGFDFGLPLWVSSMTGGTEKAKVINKNLALACGEFKLGMGLGSCRPLLDSLDRLEDFAIRKYMPNSPLYSNLGIAQCEELIASGSLDKVIELNKRLEVDGIVIHVNPLQEWAQAEGDRFKVAPIDTISKLCDALKTNIIVKEVGQGMGPKSLNALLNLPIKAIELAGFGGTNFTILEQTRLNELDTGKRAPSSNLGLIGHTPAEMIGFLNTLIKSDPSEIEIIISGGVKDSIQGFSLMQSLELNSVVGMAGELLKYATGDYEVLQRYLNQMKDEFAMAKSFIK